MLLIFLHILIVLIIFIYFIVYLCCYVGVEESSIGGAREDIDSVPEVVRSFGQWRRKVENGDSHA